MDNLSYHYKANTNQLHKVSDAATDAAPGDYSKYNDIKQGQANNNYQYDEIGNLVSDASESLTNITWTVYGKIASITKGGAVIRYVYDASGNRIFKYTATDTTAYVRDASGNVLSVYTRTTSTSLQQTETHLYGSTRLGIKTAQTVPDSVITLSAGFISDGKRIFTRAEKIFELSNHLGNVLVTLSDRRVQHSAGGAMVDYYRADVASANDYYPFGMMMPGRKYSAVSGYRYGFNGKENDNEVKGEGNAYDFGARIYDSRLGRWLSVDPLQSKYPDVSPYIAFNNNPIFWVDPDGRDIYPNGIKNTAYWDTYQSLLTNPTAKSLLQKFENNKDFNLTLREGTFPVTSVTDAHHGVSSRQVHRSTGKVASQNSFIEFNLKRTKIELTRTFNGVEYNYTRTMTDFYKFSTTLHELIHAKIGYADSKQNDLEAGNNHNYFANNYFNTLVKGLTEYAKSNNLDLTEQEIKETAFVGLRKTDLFKKYIKGLADNNKTTVEQEEEAYEKRINVITWKTTAVKASDNTLVIDGAESDKFNVKKEK